jgi:hypothetical protein
VCLIIGQWTWFRTPNQNHVSTALIAFVMHSVTEFPKHTNVCYFKTAAWIQMNETKGINCPSLVGYTVKHNTSNIDTNTLHRRHVSAHITAIFTPYANVRTNTAITAPGRRRHLLSTYIIKISIRIVVTIWRVVFSSTHLLNYEITQRYVQYKYKDKSSD